jgi:capsular polysaccharide biosynthesis protein
MVEVDRLMLANSELGLAYFGHWLQDDCPAFEALQDVGTVLSAPRPVWPDCAVYETLFGQDWREHRLIVAREIVLHADIAYSRSKGERLSLLRRRLRDGLPSGGAGRIVFLDRGERGERRAIANAHELRAAFERQGIRIVSPEGGSREMVANMLDADIVIGVEGSHMAHAEFAIRDRGGLVLLQPPERFWAHQHEWSRVLEMTTGVVIGTAQGGDFRIEPGEVFDMVDRVLAEI